MWERNLTGQSNRLLICTCGFESCRSCQHEVPLALFIFTNAWNEFLFAFLFVSKANLKTWPVGPQGMILGDVIPWGQLMAASIIMAVPVVILYGYAQRFLVEGLTAGSVKG
jgi:multiple sugar transport system permease protein